jgi:hypothetical protein
MKYSASADVRHAKTLVMHHQSTQNNLTLLKNHLTIISHQTQNEQKKTSEKAQFNKSRVSADK